MPKGAGTSSGDKGIDGVKKAAILLIALGPEKSSQVFKHLKEEEIDGVKKAAILLIALLRESSWI